MNRLIWVRSLSLTPLVLIAVVSLLLGISPCSAQTSGSNSRPTIAQLVTELQRLWRFDFWGTSDLFCIVRTIPSLAARHERSACFDRGTGVQVPVSGSPAQLKGVVNLGGFDIRGVYHFLWTKPGGIDLRYIAVRGGACPLKVELGDEEDLLDCRGYTEVEVAQAFFEGGFLGLMVKRLPSWWGFDASDDWHTALPSNSVYAWAVRGEAAASPEGMYDLQWLHRLAGVGGFLWDMKDYWDGFWEGYNECSRSGQQTVDACEKTLEELKAELKKFKDEFKDFRKMCDNPNLTDEQRRICEDTKKLLLHMVGLLTGEIMNLQDALRAARIAAAAAIQ